MAMLAVIALCEQTALNSISPYLPRMAASFPEVDQSQVGVYVGTIASSFALAQFLTNFFWGWLSDRIGRKPVILTGTFLTAACFVAFGFCRTLWQAILVQALMGLVNGNQGVVSTCLGEITDRSNQSKAFTYLPVIYGLGGITGPIVGGLLVYQRNPFDPSKTNPYPYLGPNLASAAVLTIDLFLTMIFLEESLEEARNLPPLGKRVKSVFAWMWQFTGSSTRPTYLRTNGKHPPHRGLPSATSDNEDDEDASDGDEDIDRDTPMADFLPHHSGDELTTKDVFNQDTVLLLVTYLIFQFSNISYNSLYPIFASAPTPTGRDLSPQEIGLSLAFAGVVTILFQVGIFGKLRDKMGNRYTYRAGLAGFVAAFVMMPWVGYKNSTNGDGGMSSGKIWLWVELGLVLLIKTVAAVGGLTSALLMVGTRVLLLGLSADLVLRLPIPLQTILSWVR
jgi:MFS family permease